MCGRNMDPSRAFPPKVMLIYAVGAPEVMFIYATSAPGAAGRTVTQPMYMPAQRLVADYSKSCPNTVEMWSNKGGATALVYVV